MYERSVKANPNSSETQEAWLSDSLDVKDFKSAQRVRSLPPRLPAPCILAD